MVKKKSRSPSSGPLPPSLTAPDISFSEMSKTGVTSVAQTLPPPTEVPLQKPTDPSIYSFRWMWYIVSCLVPYAGTLISLFLYDHEVRDIRLMGRNCLLLSFLVWAVLPLMVFSLIVLLGLMTFSSLCVQLFHSGM